MSIEVIIPVYNAHDDLTRCVASVLEHATGDYRLLLINDASPDPRIAPLVAAMAAGKAQIRTLANDHNLGFIGTVNRGFAETTGDVVLLNSDTIVTSGWLDKIRRCADSDPRIATITPFSNNAEICSYPEMCGNHDWVRDSDPEIPNRALELASRQEYPDLPTAVGFCMYIRRAALHAVGSFDPRYGLGYGEENDFCRRLVQAGWRNVLLDDTFVAHVGNRSFDAKKAALVAANSELLVSRFPDYPGVVHDFIAGDKPRSIRLFAQSIERILRAPDRPGVLHVVHGRGGGTEHHVRHLVDAIPQYRHYVLVALGDRWEVEDLASGTRRPIAYAFERKTDELWGSYLRGIADTFAVAFVHVHHLSGSRIGLLTALKHANLPYGVTVHDFHLACPTITLMDVTDRFCGGQTDPEACKRCLSAQPGLADIPIRDWRSEHGAFLAGARFLLAPSQSAADLLARYYAPQSVHVVPHDKPGSVVAPHEVIKPKFVLPDDGVPVIGILGAIGPVKGARKVERLVELTRQRRLPVRWVLIGYLDRQYLPVQDRDMVFTLHGPYHADEIPALIDYYRVKMTVFPSAGPETFSYTLTESFAAGRPALVPPIGALGERVRATGGGWLMTEWENEHSILEQLQRILSPAGADAFAQAAANAARGAVAGAGRMGMLTRAIYDGLVSDPPTAPHIADKDRVYAALDAARADPPPAPASGMPRSAGWLTRAAHVAVKFRYTRTGRWVARSLPPSWQRRLKARLLSSI